MKKNKLAVMALGLALMFSACSNQKTQESVAETTVVESVAETKAEKESEVTESSELTTVEREDSNEYITKYLKEYFDVEVPDQVDATVFAECLKKICGGQEIAVSEELNWNSAVSAAIDAANYRELALTYPEEKIKERLNGYGIDPAAGADVACALDVELISEEEAEHAAKADPISKEEMERLLMDIAEANGDARNYLAYSDDPEIYGKLDQAWNSFMIFDDEKLAEVGKTAVEQQISTGYGIKSDAYAARFLPERTIQYGHSDIRHAHQLIGLLNSENIVARVQLEPKISIYQYLLDWGPIPEATPTYEVKQFGDLYLVYAVEYDMQLEFLNEEDLFRFDEVINKYAKKNEGNEEAKGLIAESWWQPLYSTTRTDMPEDAYHLLYDCVVRNGIYTIHPFSTPENKDVVMEKLKALAGDLEVTAEARYANMAFYHYLSGTDYQ